MTDIPVTASQESDGPDPQLQPGVGSSTNATASDSGTTDQLRQEIDHLRRMLGTQPVIEQAKGVLMHRYDIDADMAFSLLTRWSQALEQRVSVIAAVLLQVAEVSEGDDADPVLVAALRAQMGTEWRQAL